MDILSNKHVSDVGKIQGNGRNSNGYPKYGHIVHLIDVTKEGLVVHDPYSKTYFKGSNYYNVMHTNANERKGKNTEKGKKILWKYNDLKNAKAVYIAYLRVLKRK